MKEFCSRGKAEGKSTVLDLEDHTEEKTTPDIKSFYYGSYF